MKNLNLKLEDIQFWPLGSGELPRIGTLPNLTFYYYSGKDCAEICKVDTQRKDFRDYAELVLPMFEVSFIAKNPTTLNEIQSNFVTERQLKLQRLCYAAMNNGNKILPEQSVFITRIQPTSILTEDNNQLWYEEITIALATKKKRGEPRNEYKFPLYTPKHEENCNIFTNNGKPYDGICTCGAGLRYLKYSGDDQHLTNNDKI